MNQPHTCGPSAASLPASGRPLTAVLLGAARRIILRRALHGSIRWTSALPAMAKLDSLSVKRSAHLAGRDAKCIAQHQLEGAAA